MGEALLGVSGVMSGLNQAGGWSSRVAGHHSAIMACSCLPSGLSGRRDSTRIMVITGRVHISIGIYIIETIG